MRTVDLGLLQELLAPHTTAMGLDWDTLPVEEDAQREKLFEVFKTGGENFPDALLDALHCILILSTPNGTRALDEIAQANGVALVPESELAEPGDGRHLSARPKISESRLFVCGSPSARRVLLHPNDDWC